MQELEKKYKKIYSNWFESFNFVSISSNFNDAREKIHKNLEKNWKAKSFRKDTVIKLLINENNFFNFKGKKIRA